MIKISVIIPIFNSAEHLSKCLESLCGQDLREIEIICVNDCSTDDSLAILQKFAGEDSRIKIINLKENKGAAFARNIGVEKAVGEYLGFVDSDDFIDQNFYKKLFSKAQETNADAVKGNIRIYCPTKKSITSDTWIDINESVKSHPANFYFTFTSAIYKTAFIKENSIKFLEGLIHFEDPYFTIHAALFYQKLEVLDDVFYYYVNNPNSTSRQKIEMKHIESMLIGLGKVLDLLDCKRVDKTHYMIVFNFLLEQILCWCNRIDVSDEINSKAVAGLFFLFSRCKYKEECAIEYFLQKKKNHKKEIAKQLRARVKNA